VLGRLLFRWRGVIGVVAFGVVFWPARPTFGSCLFGLPIILAGLATRFWASGYIGIEGRAREIGASRRIASGPYRVLRHPLYIGNFLLVAGMLVALRPAWWMAVVVMAGFAFEYGLIVAAEERHLRQKWSSGQVVKWSVRSPESAGGKQGTVNGENRRQSLGAPASNSARYSPRFPRPCEGAVPVFRQSPESFLLRRALVEWRTWVATGVAWGLAMAKALLVRG
jgi:hypothetical protein